MLWRWLHNRSCMDGWSSLADALAVAAYHQPRGTPAAAVLAAAAGSAFLRVSRPSDMCQKMSCAPAKPSSAAALAVAAHQQPPGTRETLAAAAGRAYLRISGDSAGLPAPRSRLAAEGRSTLAAPQRQVYTSAKQMQSERSLPCLCQDTSSRILCQLWPGQQPFDKVDHSGHDTSSSQ